MPTIAVRPYLVFLLLPGIVVAAESAALASRGMMIRPDLVRAAVIFDLCALVLRPIRIEGGALLLRLGVLGIPNLALKLHQPMQLHGPFGIRKRSDTLLVQVDEPDALAGALRANVSSTA
jgi:hypothetical protein